MAEPFSDGLGRWLDRADRLLRPLEYALTLFGGVLVFLLMILGMVQIVLRNIFQSPIFGYIDIVEFSMVGFAVLGIAFVQQQGAHVRMEIIIGRLKGRWHWIIEAFGALAVAAIVAILIPYSYEHFARAFSIGDSTIDIELPTWPAKLAVPIALGLLLARVVVQFAGYLRLAANPDLDPVAVPHLKSVEEIAAEEIESTQ